MDETRWIIGAHSGHDSRAPEIVAASLTEALNVAAQSEAGAPLADQPVRWSVIASPVDLDPDEDVDTVVWARSADEAIRKASLDLVAAWVERGDEVAPNAGSAS